MSSDEKRSPNAQPRKKARSGDRRRRRPIARESALALIDRLLAELVPITFNGETKQVPAIEAIVLQLIRAEMNNNAQAARTLLKYREIAYQNADKRLEVIFLESDYTKALSGRSETPGQNNE